MLIVRSGPENSKRTSSRTLAVSHNSLVSQTPSTLKRTSKFTDSILCLVRAGHYEPSYTQSVTDYLDSDVLLVNQTANTLQNLCLDFATLGDLKLVERPTVYTIAPHSFQSIKATIKVSSTETGVIFGSILWEGPGMAEQCVILNDIHIDIMDYIKPAYCNEAQVSDICDGISFILC